MDLQTKTCELPGIGKRVSFPLSTGQTLVLIIHNTGKKEVYVFNDPDDDEAKFYLTLTNEEARKLAAELLGITYQPTALDKIRTFRNEIVLEWVEVEKGSFLEGKSIKEAKIRNRTGASIIAIIRGDEIITSPEGDEILKAGDTLIFTGKPGQVELMEELCHKKQDK